MEDRSKLASFEATILPHLGSAYNFVRWLLRNDGDAEDVVQETYLRAFKFFGGYHGGDSRAWLLTIARNTCYTWLQQNRSRELMNTIDDAPEIAALDDTNPETLLLQRIDEQQISKALEELPIEFREVMLLREMEGLSYKEIATLAAVPIGTVMSRLARARKRLQQTLAGRLNQEV